MKTPVLIKFTSQISKLYVKNIGKYYRKNRAREKGVRIVGKVVGCNLNWGDRVGLTENMTFRHEGHEIIS